MKQQEERLELDSRLDELSRVHPWVEQIAERHNLGEKSRFAIHLCMEEALANVILHGYHGERGHPINIRASVSGDALYFAIEDHAPPFTPDEPGTPIDTINPVAGLEVLTPGGNGIRLMRRFAESVEYQRLPTGNRLTIGFLALSQSS
jgi:serine/threonine-protein kinase RsbW